MEKTMWIWFPGEMESAYCNPILFRRDYRLRIEPPFWKVEAPYPSVFFYKKLHLARPETMTIESETVISVKTEPSWEHILPDEDGSYTLPAGNYTLVISAYSLNGSAPSVRVLAETFKSDPNWTAAVDNVRGERLPVGFSEQIGCDFQLERIEVKSVRDDVFDFGREVFGHLRLENIVCPGELLICYGESLEEAMDSDRCEIIDRAMIDTEKADWTCAHTRGFRYVKVIGDARFKSLCVMAESLPLKKRGAFSANEWLDQIYDTSLYTLKLCAREAFLDGLKRDRWFWSGDAYQSYLCNYYSFFDKDINRRTSWALRGKKPVSMHINHIPDYSCWWLISLKDHWMYIGDDDYIKSAYPFAVTLMDFCLSRLDEHGLFSGQDGDWVFIDWADMSHDGALCAEQVLLWAALDAMNILAQKFGNNETALHYQRERDALKKRIFEIYYDKHTGILRHTAIDGKATDDVTRYANLFAVLFGMIDSADRNMFIKNVNTDTRAPVIVTPYCKFFELAFSCEAGDYDRVLRELKHYWGGMLQLGATTFWEQYDPEATSHTEMYNRPYGKSLCHAWGANPLYILGRYFLGVRPVESGYREYVVEPKGLDKMSGRVPTPYGDIEVKVEKDFAYVRGVPNAKGVLCFAGKLAEIPENGEARICMEE